MDAFGKVKNVLEGQETRLNLQIAENRNVLLAKGAKCWFKY